MRNSHNLESTFFLVRHGETEWNRSGRWQGQQDIPLSETGRAQAKMLAVRFQTIGRPIDALFSSDLARAMETAAAIGRAIRKTPTPIPALREIHLGAWEGHSIDEITKLFPQEWARLEAGEDVARGGGETYGAFQKRILAWLDATASVSSGQTVVAVTHGGCIRSVLLGIRGLAWSERHRIPSIENASITSLRHTSSGWKILEDADTDHLRAMDSGVTAQVTLDEGKIV